jgi:hypothetical protein
MRLSSTHLKYISLALAVVAVILAFAGVDESAGASSRVNPGSPVAMAIVAYVFVRASESSSTGRH